MTMNFVPFAERCVEMVTDMYKATAQHPTVVNSNVLQQIIKVSTVTEFSENTYSYTTTIPTDV